MSKGYILSAHRSEADPIKKAAYNKQPRATFGLGLLYYYGYIVPKQKSKAIKFFEESSALGYSFASTFLNK